MRRPFMGLQTFLNKHTRAMSYELFRVMYVGGGKEEEEEEEERTRTLVQLSIVSSATEPSERWVPRMRTAPPPSQRSFDPPRGRRR